MDILQIIKPKIKPLKASYDKLSLKSKFFILFICVSLVGISLPHQTEAVGIKNSGLVFEIGNYTDYIVSAKQVVIKRALENQRLAEQARKKKLSLLLEQYLKNAGSPLANHASTLISVEHWKKIIALANAESSLCRKYPEELANCWGVGGANLLKLGNNLDEAIITMNRFLARNPKKSQIKYAQMDFNQMNGLYKKPAADHWVINSEVVYQDLINLEQSL